MDLPQKVRSLGCVTLLSLSLNVNAGTEGAVDCCGPYAFVGGAITAASVENQRYDQFGNLWGGYGTLGAVWPVSPRWGIGAQLGYNYIGDARNRSIIDEIIIPLQVYADFKYQSFEANALLVYHTTPKIDLRGRAGVAVVNTQSKLRIDFTNLITALGGAIPPFINSNINFPTNISETNVLAGVGLSYQLFGGLFATVDYTYINAVNGINSFRLGLEKQFA